MRRTYGRKVDQAAAFGRFDVFNEDVSWEWREDHAAELAFLVVHAECP